MRKCLPIMAEDFREVYEIVESYNDNTKVDMYELRADTFLDDMDYDGLMKGWSKLKELSKKPILFTYRTRFEGGLGKSSITEYNEVVRTVIKEVKPEYLDLELSRCCSDANAKMYIRLANHYGTKTILSKHDLIYTGSAKEIEMLFMRMHYLGCHMPKIAAMANDEKDVISMVIGAEKAKSQIGDLIAISMGKMGVKTRLPGNLNKSAIGFAKPVGRKVDKNNSELTGQIDIEEM